MSDRVSCTIEGGIADVRLTRPEKRNALDQAMFSAILAAAEQVGADPSVRAVVLSGEGRGFCSGLDFESFQSMQGGDGLGGGEEYGPQHDVREQQSFSVYRTDGGQDGSTAV